MGIRKSRVNGSWRIALLIYSVFCIYIIAETAYWSYQLWKRRGDFGIVERKKSLIRPFSYSLILWMVTRMLQSWMTAHDLYRSDIGSLGWYISSSNTLVATATFQCVCAFLCLRVWLIFFDVSLATATSDTQWVALINQPVVYRPDILATLDMINVSLLDPADHPANRHGSSVSFRALSSITSLYREPSVLRKKSSIWGGGKSYGNRSHNGSGNQSAAGVPSANRMRSTVTSAMTGISSTMSRGRGFTSFFSVHGPGGNSDNWFIRVKYSFGNVKWLKQQLLWIIPILVTFITIPQIIRPLSMLGQSLVALIYCCCAIFPAVMAYYFPKFNDTLRMMAELRLIFLILVISSVGFASYIIADLVFQNTYFQGKSRERKNEYELWFSILSNSFFIMFGRLLCLSQTKWVLLTFPPSESSNSSLDNDNNHRISLSVDGQTSDKHEIRDISFGRALFGIEWMRDHWLDLKSKWSVMSVSNIPEPGALMVPTTSDPIPSNAGGRSSSASASSSQSHDSDVITKQESLSPPNVEKNPAVNKSPEEKSDKPMKHLSVPQLLADERGYRLFIQHLFTEFSYESLLCVLELQQFSDSIRENELNQLLVDIAEEDSFSDSDEIVDALSKVKFGSSRPEHGKTPSSMAKFAGAVRSMISLRSNTSEEGGIPNTVAHNASTYHRKIGTVSVDTVQSTKTMDVTPSTIASVKSMSGGGSSKASSQVSRVELPDSIEQVKSTIAWDLTLSKEQRYCILCKKYIALDAEMSVNISFDNRQRLMKRCDYFLRGVLPVRVTNEESLALAREEIEIKQDVFDSVISELIRLMRDSLSRFQLTEDYESLRTIFHQRKHNHVKSQSTLILGSIFGDAY